MACCGNDINKPDNLDDLLNKLRNISNHLDVPVKLNDCKMTFKAKTGRWNSK